MIIVAVSLFALAAMFWGYHILRTWHSILTAQPTKGDCIAPFCHFVLPSGELSAEFQARLARTLLFWELRHRPIIIHGGKTKGTHVSQFETARKYLSISDLVGENKGHDTLDEVRLLIKKMKEMELAHPVIISNWVHLVRIRAALRRLGVKPILVATPWRVGENYNPLVYVVGQMLLLPLTVLDPTGERWVFRNLRARRGER